MASVIINVAPVFMLILIGWVLARTGVLKHETGDALGEYVFKIAVPMLIFRTLADAHFEGASPFRLWAAYFIGVGITWTAGHLITTRLFKRDAKVGVIAGMSSSFANTIFIGLPLVSHIVGKDGLVGISILLAIHLPLMMISGTILMEGAIAKVDGSEKRGLGAILKQVGKNLVANPLVIALIAGAVFNLIGGTVTPVVKVVVDQLAASAGPAALISIGMALTRYPVSGDIKLTGTISALKLILLPASVFVASHALSLPRDWTAALVLTAAVPTGINAWLISQRYRCGQSLAASVISITTAFGVITVSFWAWLLG